MIYALRELLVSESCGFAFDSYFLALSLSQMTIDEVCGGVEFVRKGNGRDRGHLGTARCLRRVSRIITLLMEKHPTAARAAT